MSKEKFGRPKQSSTVSAKVAYERLFEAGYRPRLIAGAKPLHEENWGTVITHKSVARSISGDSVYLDRAEGGLEVVLKIKGMMSEKSLSYFSQHVGVNLKPAPAPQ